MSKNTSHAPRNWDTPRGLGNSLFRTHRAPANAEELWAMRKRAWRENGVVTVRPEEVNDPFARQALINAANGLYGPRPALPQDRQTTENEVTP